MMRYRRIVILAAAGAWACGEGTGPVKSNVLGVVIAPAGTQTTGIGGSLTLSVTVIDTLGHTVLNPTVRWKSSDPLKVRLSASSGGVVTATATASSPGVRITASSGGKHDTVSISVSSAPAPQIAAISVPTLQPGMTGVTVRGSGFAASIASDTMLVDGVPVTITAATSTQLTIDVPATGFTCTDSHDASLALVANGLHSDASYPLDVAANANLSVGQIAITKAGTRTPCVRLPGAGPARYLVAVYNSATSAFSGQRFDLHGSGPIGSPAPAVVAAPQRLAPAGVSLRASLTGLDVAVLQAGEEMHRTLLERDRTILSRRAPLRAPAPVAPQRLPTAVSGAITPAVGDIVKLHIRDINVDRDCTVGIDVGARAVYVGAKAAIFEDTAADFAGTMDTVYQHIGQEFDAVIYPMLVQYFGDPLAYDSQLGKNGRVLMLFSPVINNRFAGVAGFVSACDFFPFDTTVGPDEDLVSNEAAIFYAFVPSTSFPLEKWQPFIRGVLAHESKHLASYAAKLANNGGPEEAWLEEATAQTASEVYQRVYSGAAWKGDAVWSTSVGCEPPLTTTNGCSGDHPQVMLHHFGYLYDYLADLRSESPVAPTTAAFYGGAWSFVRWVVDQYAASEPAMLSAITQSTTHTGVDNLAFQAGADVREMAFDWMIATALLRYPSVTPPDPRFTILSWDEASIFRGMHDQLVLGDGSPAFPRSFPVVPPVLTFGTFDAPVPTLTFGQGVPGLGAAVFELSGTAAGPQVIGVDGFSGDALPVASPLWLAIIRVE